MTKFDCIVETVLICSIVCSFMAFFETVMKGV